MLAAVALLTARLWRVSQPIPTRTDPELMKTYLRGAEERNLVRDTFNENAALNGVRTLRAYEARAHRFERIAEQLEGASAEKLRTKAAAIRADVKAVTARAAALVVRKRAERVIMSWWTLLALGMFATGVMAFAVSADRLDSARDGEIKVAKACAEARTAKAVEAELPDICGATDADAAEQIALSTSRVTLATSQVALAKACAEARGVNAVEEKLTAVCGEPAAAPDAESSSPTAEDLADAAFIGLAEGWLKCRAALRKESDPGRAICTALERAMIASLQAGGR